MTSVIRFIGGKQQALTRFIKPESPCYDDNGTTRLFPFTYSNGVLNISYQGNSFQTTMVDTLNVDPIAETDTAYRMLGTPRLVRSLGDNFKAYIRAWRDGTIDANSPIEVYLPAQVVRVQEGDSNSIDANSGNSYKITTSAPSDDNYVMGSAEANYNATYVFKTPLTFIIVESGVTKYITFRSMIDQE